MRRTNSRAGQGAGFRFLQDHKRHDGDACLIWPMHRDLRGYAIVAVPFEFRVKGNGQRNAARVMCEIAHGKPPTSKHRAALSCNGGKNGCVHPGHLSWKTREQICFKGADHHNHKAHKRSWHKLTPEKVEEIRLLKSETLLALSKQFGVATETIRRIRHGKTWTGTYQSIIAQPHWGTCKPKPLKLTTPGLRALSNYPYMRGRGDDAALVAVVNDIVSRRFPDFARADICQDLLLAILEGKTTLDDLESGRSECIRRYYKQHPTKYGPLSLDAPIPGTDLLLRDTIAGVL